MVGATPVALFLREHGATWQALQGRRDERPGSPRPRQLSDDARRVLADAARRAAPPSPRAGAAPGWTRASTHGAAPSWSPPASSPPTASPACALSSAPARRIRRDRRGSGRRPLVAPDRQADGDACSDEAAVEAQAWSLLRRYGVVFRRLLAREANAAPWRELARVYRRLEARGEIRGGRFVSGMSGEQFALPDAVERLREVRRTAPDGRCSSSARPIR